MLCGDCGKSEAQVFFKQIVNNQVSQAFLCPDCARRRGLPSGAAPNLFLDLLAGLGGLLPSSAPAARARLQCSACGFRYDQLSQTGRLGCPECYRSFREPLGELIGRIHGAPRQGGTTATAAAPKIKQKTTSSSEALERLRRDIKTAVKKEDFEEAARLRDQIRRLEAEG